MQSTTLMQTVIRDLTRRMKKNHAKGRELFQSAEKRLDFDMAEELLKACAPLLLDRRCPLAFAESLANKGYKLPSSALMRALAIRPEKYLREWMPLIARMVRSWDHSDLKQFMSKRYLTSELMLALLACDTLTGAMPETREYDEREFATSSYEETGGDTRDAANAHLYRVVTRHFSQWDDDDYDLKYIKPPRVRPPPTSLFGAVVRHLANEKMHSYEQFLEIECQYGFDVAQAVLNERGLIVLDNRHCRLEMLKELATRGFKMHCIVLMEGFKHLNANLRKDRMAWGKAIMQLAEQSSWDTYYKTQFASLFGDRY